MWTSDYSGTAPTPSREVLFTEGISKTPVPVDKLDKDGAKVYKAISSMGDNVESVEVPELDLIIYHIPRMEHSYSRYFVQLNTKSGMKRIIILGVAHQIGDLNASDFDEKIKSIKENGAVKVNGKQVKVSALSYQKAVIKIDCYNHLQTMWKFAEVQRYTDVTFILGNVKIYAHKIVISSFEEQSALALLLDQTTGDVKVVKGVSVVTIADDIDPDHFREMLKVIYGNVNYVNMLGDSKKPEDLQQLINIFAAAQYFNVTKIVELCIFNIEKWFDANGVSDKDIDRLLELMQLNKAFARIIFKYYRSTSGIKALAAKLKEIRKKDKKLALAYISELLDFLRSIDNPDLLKSVQNAFKAIYT